MIGPLSCHLPLPLAYRMPITILEICDGKNQKQSEKLRWLLTLNFYILVEKIGQQINKYPLSVIRISTIFKCYYRPVTALFLMQFMLFFFMYEVPQKPHEKEIIASHFSNRKLTHEDKQLIKSHSK